MPLNSSIYALLGGLLGFVATWLLTSLAVFMAGRVVVGSKATFTKSLVLIFLGGILITLFYFVLSHFLNPLLGWPLAFILWLGLIKTFFGTGWIGSFLIAILASIMFMVLVSLAAGVLALLGFTLSYPPSVPLQPYGYVV